MTSCGMATTSSNPNTVQRGQCSYTTDHKSGVVFDEDTSEESLDEWTNPQLRKSIALHSMTRVNKTTHKYYFRREKLLFIAQAFAQSGADTLFVNTLLSALQIYEIRRALVRTKLNRPLLRTRGQYYEASESEADITEPEELEIDNVKVIDRFGVILRIFAGRAKSQLAKKQLILAAARQLRDQQARLRKSRTTDFLESAQLIKQQGLHRAGISKSQKMKRLDKQWEQKAVAEIEELKAKQKKRTDSQKRELGTAKVAIIGYTNVGKSALANALLGGHQLSSKDRLFQTLSVTTRKLVLPNGLSIALLDTIGFIHDLPTALLSPFLVTLGQLADADIFIHVLDASSQDSQSERQEVVDNLTRLGFYNSKKVIQVYNKADLLDDSAISNYTGQGRLLISAVTKEGMQKLCGELERRTGESLGLVSYSLRSGLADYDSKRNWLVREAGCRVLDESFNYEGNRKHPKGYVDFKVTMAPQVYNMYRGIEARLREK